MMVYYQLFVTSMTNVVLINNLKTFSAEQPHGFEFLPRSLVNSLSVDCMVSRSEASTRTCGRYCPLVHRLVGEKVIPAWSCRFENR